MMEFIMGKPAEDSVHSTYLRSSLDIRGSIQCSGTQPIGTPGGAPLWVFELMRQYPQIKQLALSFENSGVVYSNAVKGKGK